MSDGEATEDLESAWTALLANQNRLGSDRKLANLALGLIQQMGNGVAHRDVLHALAEAWTPDWRLTLTASSLLVEQAGRRGMDEPTLTDDGPASWAAAALQRSLDALSDAERANADLAGNMYAMLGNALRLCGPGRDAEAQEAFTRAIELDPERGEWWYDAGLLDKWRGRFDDGYAANEQARMRMGPQRPVLWNLAICATALGKAEEAAEIWEEIGVPARLDRSRGMPYVAGLPPMLLRVLSRTSPTDGTSSLPDKTVGFELVWIAPLSPCHGVVQSPIFGDAPIDYGDLVLWDGAPVAAHRTSAGDTVPVFPLLEVLRPGSERRWSFVALETEPGAREGLEDALPEGTRVFVQDERVGHHCAACEAGDPHEHEEAVSGAGTVPVPASGPVPGSVSLVRGKVIVQPTQDLEAFRDAWEAAARARPLSVSLPALYEELGDSKRAGQEHQAWRGIEGKAIRQKAGA
ncbi:MAG: tetratricopeptide repeat protein [Deltaproteobacteria bacterium]|nr:tetratricopeptide repeat protein [Deltaproteobacteria bacterium]MBW1874851.1 tetratricopeptide repeat protein [Deltaproteobacteria bacterium]MBW2209582.1 tetratricopeptide repeat protein [Deltaproteobacteria bacterium]MBW2213427.1 tetratricopeptide repeat protein [Deltaproteobacteria bacterium]MBW2379432.1 tetratricopeptide repeat protein [Deltaproteobacteria bacterium]